MYKETVTYTDYNGKERTEDCYFNLSKAEVAEMQLSYKQGMDKYIQDMVDNEDTPAMAKFFKEFIFKSYGVKSEDGRRFIKSEEQSIEFSQTEAYNEIVFRLLSDEDYMGKVVTAILPSQDEIPDKPQVVS